MVKPRLAIVSTHPVQYNAPFFQSLAEEGIIDIKVFYTWSQSKTGPIEDRGFRKRISWDIPLLDGYDYEFIDNLSKDPGCHHFKGIVNPSLKDKISFWNPDAILVYGWNYHSHLDCIRYFSGRTKVLFRGDSTLYDEKRGIKRIIRKIFLTWVYKQVDYALFTGTANKEYYIKFGLSGARLIFAPHSIDLDRFHDKELRYSIRALEWRKQLGYGENDFILLFAGKIEPKKDPEILIQLAQTPMLRQVKIMMVGTGPLESDLKQKASQIDAIRFLDFQNQSLMPVVYRLANAFILPSIGPGETWGLAVNEAMACGLPVIASDRVGCAIDLVSPGVNGYLFQAGNLGSLASAAYKLIESKDIKEMGQRSLELIQDWNYSKVRSAIYSILKPV